MRTYLLDTSAVVAHYRREPGHGEVQALFEDSGATMLLAAPSLVELHGVLQSAGVTVTEQRSVLDLYGRQLAECVSVDRAAAEAAMRLRGAAAARLPLVDALIAGCAAARKASLVHRDPHFDALPAGLLSAVRLPDREPLPTSRDVPTVVKKTTAPYKQTHRKPRRRR